MARRDLSAWMLGGGALLVLYAGAKGSRRAGPGAPKPARKSPPARARAEGPGDHDMISYVVDTSSGLILVRTQASDVDWGVPQLKAEKATAFRGGVQRYASIIDEAGADYRIPSEWIDAIAWAESGFDPSAKSKAGALGMLQVMPFHFTEAEKPNAFDPRTNVRVGARLLSAARAGFRDLVQVASAYNAGGPQGPAGGPWTNEAWLAANRNPSLTSRWGYVCEPGYIDTVVAAYNTDTLQRKGQA